MKRGLVIVGVIFVIALAVVFFLRFRVAAVEQTAATAEQKGNHAGALERYVRALDDLFPGTTVPDINRSKVLPAPSWEKEMNKVYNYISAQLKIEEPLPVATTI